MPIIQINIAAGKTNEQKKEMYKLVTEAMVKSVGVKEEAVTIFVNEYDLSDIGKAGKSYPEFLGSK
ncbi:hypothetical protein SCACP_04970 [Sporomusa carbonis]|uniref:tautomerase family protein n=1 Tax=Sporomusa carbonis TaxID=3076075 RepID=UPI003A5D7A0D